jgi:hypothetical protein
MKKRMEIGIDGEWHPVDTLIRAEVFGITGDVDGHVIQMEAHSFGPEYKDVLIILSRTLRVRVRVADNSVLAAYRFERRGNPL